jgi:MFS family permease
VRRPVARTSLGRNRDFLILWSAEAASALGTSMSMLVFPLVSYAITGSPAQAGLATTAVLLGEVVARLPAGALVDRWPRGRVLLAYLFGAACYGSLAVAALAHSLTLAQLVVIGLLSGVVDSFAAPATSAAVRTVVTEPDLPLAYSRLQIRQHAANLIGPPLGGALYSVARGLPFLLDAVSYLIGALSISRLRTPLPAPDPGTVSRSVVADVAEGLRFVWRHAAIRAILLWGAAINFSVTLVLVTVTLRLVRAGVHPSAIGLIDSVAAAAGVLGALVAPLFINRLRTGVMTVTTSLMLAVVVVPMAWTDSVAVIGGLLAIGTFLLPANNSGISAYQVTVTPDRLQGRVNSAGGFIAMGVAPVGPVLAGVLVGSAGGRVATLTGAAFVALSLVPLLTSSAVRNLGRPDSWAVKQLPGGEAASEL